MTTIATRVLRFNLLEFKNINLRLFCFKVNLVLTLVLTTISQFPSIAPC